MQEAIRTAERTRARAFTRGIVANARTGAQGGFLESQAERTEGGQGPEGQTRLLKRHARPPGAAPMTHAPLYTVEFYEEANGFSPVFQWMTEVLSPAQRRAVTAALEELVAPMGPDIVATEFGKNLGGGIIELRLRQGEEQLLRRVGKAPRDAHPEDTGEEIFLRIFFHAHGQKRALVLHGYDKGRNAAKRYQQQQIGVAEARLARFKQREKQEGKVKRRQAHAAKPKPGR
ncbi:hypothetical protein ASNO1_10290 [Corallococcus caeni]|uniref:Type II toxin-antitoxin system RelE/ParE family toxin n=2 Tax=Corallococcus caeni TaxID=3082388 RepID=A0ABQ6QLS5_9BACT|nr:hypothetical protein ASNO1_10290 [Corallococcus sp. NO1]